MSTRATRSSARKGANGQIATSVENSAKSVASERRRRQQPQHQKIDELQNNVNGKHSEHSDDGDEGIHVTPPKQRKQAEKANQLSPSTLLDRLSLGAQNENQSTNTNGEKPKTESRIDNARKVLNAAETEELYGREREIAELNEFLSTHLTKKASASIYISGQPGILSRIYLGKTIGVLSRLHRFKYAHFKTLFVIFRFHNQVPVKRHAFESCWIHRLRKNF